MTIKPSARCWSMVGVLCAAPSLALAEQNHLDDVVVTATRMEQPQSAVLADVTVISPEEIQRSGATGVADVLARTPGVQFSRNGGPGSSTSVFLRGADTRFTAVFVDGVRVDSQSTGGATWESIPLAQVDRIEVLRGPAAAVYGSDAIAGVIQIFTKKGANGFSPYIGMGIGSNQLKKLEAGFSGGNQQFDYALGVSKETSDGFNTLRTGNPDKDGYQSESASVRLGWNATQVHRFEVAALRSDMDSQYDGSLTTDDYNHHNLDTLGLTWKAKWNAQLKTQFSVSESTSRYETTPSPFLTQTRVRDYLLMNTLQRASWNGSVTLERREDTLDNSSTTPAVTSRDQNALGLGYGWQPGLHAFQVNVRRDDDSEFGGKTTGQVAYAYQFMPQWKVNASAGTAFRAPTLFQRFSVFGSSTLQPESSNNRELGLTYSQQDTEFGLTYYKNKIENLISFIGTSTACASGFGCYESTKHAELEGVTLTASTTVKTVHVAASLDFLDPKDVDTGRNLARRAEKHASLSLDAPLGQWQVGGELLAYGSRFDNAANTVALGGYSVVNMFATRKVKKDVSLVLRANNVFDKDYQLANNYNTQGRSFFAGVRWGFGS
jgi:vitamin B12 transporter